SSFTLESMSNRLVTSALCASALAISVGSAHAQEQQPQPPATPLVCASAAGERQVCPGDTSAGVALVKSTGTAACLLGKTWGYDDAGVWVAEGCSGEFQLGEIAAAPAGAPAPPAAKPPYVPVETWGEFDPGKGFLIGRSALGELDISAYALVRYVN